MFYLGLYNFNRRKFLEAYCENIHTTYEQGAGLHTSVVDLHRFHAVPVPDPDPDPDADPDPDPTPYLL